MNTICICLPVIFFARSHIFATYNQIHLHYPLSNNVVGFGSQLQRYLLVQK